MSHILVDSLFAPELEVPVVLMLMLAAFGYMYFHGPDKRLDRFLIAAALAVPSQFLAAFCVTGVGLVRPHKFDLYVYWIDNLLGFQPSFALGHAITGHRLIMAPLAVTYRLLPVAMVAIFGAYLWCRSEHEAMSMISVFILNLTLSVPFYLMFPVCGPEFAFPNFPALPNGPVVPHPILLNAPANGVPSVHFSTALLIFWYARRLPFGRLIGGAYLVLTAVATTASGQHYVFDLLAAVPYAVLVYKLGPFAARSALAAVRVKTRTPAMELDSGYKTPAMIP
jgi:PAP2 superfamily